MNRKITVSNEVIKTRYIAEVLGGLKTGGQLARELGISGSRLSRIVKPSKAKPMANNGKPVHITPSHDAKAKDVAEGILLESLNDLNAIRAALRKDGKQGKIKALGLVNKVIRILELAKKEPDVTKIDARTVNIIKVEQIPPNLQDELQRRWARELVTGPCKDCPKLNAANETKEVIVNAG